MPSSPSRRTVTTALAAGLALPAATAATARAAAPDAPSTAADAPALVPAPRHRSARPGAWRPRPGTRISAAPGLTATARLLADELAAEGYLPAAAPVVPPSPDARGGIALALGRVDGGPEAYRLTVDRDGATVVGAGPDGVHHGTRTLLQLLRAGRGAAPAGTVEDAPAYRHRGLMVDVGRKYFTPEWLTARIRELSWLKLNTLHLHLSDGSGFRFESASHPESVTRPALSADDVRGLVREAERHRITLVPEIDSPGHLEAALTPHPELQLVTNTGRRYAGNLDYSKPEARAFVRDLLTEVCELFPGPLVHLGGDEYFGYPWDTDNLITGENCPQLLKYAREQAGPDATVQDGFTAYLDELAALAARHGKRAVVWNDDIDPRRKAAALTPSARVENWIRWNDTLPALPDYLDAGYGTLNAHGDYLYFILAPDAQHETGKKSAQGIYDLWSPLRYMAAPGQDADLPSAPANLLGSQLSIWCDNPDFQSEDEVAAAVGPWLRAFAQQLWGSPKPAPDWSGFAPIAQAAGQPPKV